MAMPANILVVLTLVASGHCFMSALIDGPLKAAYSMFGSQGGRAAVGSPTAFRQMAPAPVVKSMGGNNYRTNGGYNDYPMGGYDGNAMGGRQRQRVVSLGPSKNGGWDNRASGETEEAHDSWNRRQKKNRSNNEPSGETQEGYHSWNRRQRMNGRNNGRSNNRLMSMGSSQNSNSWQNMRDTDFLQDWFDDSDDVVQGVMVRPASSFVIVAQPAKSTSSRGVVYRHSAGKMLSHNLFNM